MKIADIPPGTVFMDLEGKAYLRLHTAPIPLDPSMDPDEVDSGFRRACRLKTGETVVFPNEQVFTVYFEGWKYEAPAA